MIPTSFIFTATFFFLLFPMRNSGDQSIQKEKEVKNFSSMSVNLHFNSTPKNSRHDSDTDKKTILEFDKKTLELPPESFTETPLQLESWMKSPKNWSNNKD